ncbi:MAG TPA: aminodeoxychorismate synthase component I, partial [Propionibacteriaceae bacterium]|nr:aminodeoxychorismate synthase component I [Propionibacteriaceae bacterium]
SSLLPDPAGAWVGPVRPHIDYGTYARRFAVVHDHIESGDIYQANLTFQASARYAGSPLALYAALRSTSQAGHGAVVWTGSQWVLSLSPELFVSLEGRTVTAKPMKGTAARSPDPAEDASLAEQLRLDPKQRAENVMIVDLLRNDLGRVARLGSVAVPRLFEVTTYPTVHQLTSTVTATLRDGLDALDLVAASFPCGSVTGAPKISAMQILAGLEDGPRGVYCGSIGHLDPSGDASFNVAIRTLVLDEERSTATLGLGSGLVADSTPEAEWRECLDKAAFLDLGRSVELVETMRVDSRGVRRLELHLARLAASAEALGVACDTSAVRELVLERASAVQAPSRVRVVLSSAGTTCGVSPLPASPPEPWSVRLVPLPVDAADFRLRHKTTDRAFHDRARLDSGADEVVFVRPDGLLTEGSFTALFVPRGDVLLTPRTESGALDSVLRRELVASGRAVPSDLRAPDLAGGFLLGNSLRGLVQARLITTEG